MKPRYYQTEAMEALHNHICSKVTSPCVVLPTGSGKSPLMAWIIQRYMEPHPALRVIVVVHVRELVRQNADKMKLIWPEADIGVYSAGLKSRDIDNHVIFAGIQSVYSRALEFEPFDLVFIDEAHRIPLRGEGMYRQFIKDARMNNPKVVLVGMTATPWRLTSGPICHKDHILNEIVYEANVKKLIQDGFLCSLRSKIGDTQPDVSKVKKSRGDFINSELAKVVDKGNIVQKAVAEMVPMLKDRKAILFFCVNIKHCWHVSEELALHGIESPPLTSKTPLEERDETIQKFQDGKLRGICNVQVLCEGFDATHVDSIVLLRPTHSMGLYSQMVGRGLRIDDRKPDCLVLCFSGNVEVHGPLDLLEAGEAKTMTCPDCKEVFSIALKECPDCGWKVPDKPAPTKTCPKCKALNPISAEECVECGFVFVSAERKVRHRTKASEAPIISDYIAPERVPVTKVMIQRHKKQGKPDSLKVIYWSRLTRYSEWVCLDHGGFAGEKAAYWWRRRFGSDHLHNVNEVFQNVDAITRILNDITESIMIQKAGKYVDIKQIFLKEEVRESHV